MKSPKWSNIRKVTSEQRIIIKLTDNYFLLYIITTCIVTTLSEGTKPFQEGAAGDLYVMGVKLGVELQEEK